MVSVPVRMDDGTWTMFPGYRVLHSSVLGPTKGGIRYDPHVSLGECAALAMWMTWKCALLRLPYGGAKGGVRCNPREMSLDEVQRLTRRFTIELLPVIGPEKDIPAPDMATNEQTMAWMMDTYSMQVGYAVPEVVTGKPISIGGSVFRSEATGAGVVMVIERACHRLGWNLARAAVRRAGLRQRRRRRRARPSRARRHGARGLGHLGRRLLGGRARPRSRHGVDRGARDARGLPGRRARLELGAARAALRHPRSRRARGAADRRERARASNASSSPRARTGRPRSRRTTSSPSAGSSSCRTSSRTPAASRSRTSSGCRISAGSSGTARRSARSSPTS